MFRFVMAVCLVVMFLVPVAMPASAGQAEACGIGVGTQVFQSSAFFQTQAFVPVQTNFALVSPFVGVQSAFVGGGANVNVVESRGGLFGRRSTRVIQAQAGGGNANVNIVENRRRGLFGLR